MLLITILKDEFVALVNGSNSDKYFYKENIVV